MIIRIVSLQFQLAKAELGKQLLRKMAPEVIGFQGCSHVKILFDMHHAGKVFTYSHWDSEEALNKYRNSESFVAFWSGIRPLFEARAIARSTQAALTFP